MVINSKNVQVPATPSNPTDVVRKEDLIPFITKITPFTITPEDWLEKKVQVSFEGMTPNSCVDISLQVGTSKEEFESLLKAQLVAKEQGIGYILFEALGEVPTVGLNLICEDRGEPYAG